MKRHWEWIDALNFHLDFTVSNDETFRREKAIAIGIVAHLQCKQARRCFDTKKNINSKWEFHKMNGSRRCCSNTLLMIQHIWDPLPSYCTVSMVKINKTLSAFEFSSKMFTMRICYSFSVITLMSLWSLFLFFNCFYQWCWCSLNSFQQYRLIKFKCILLYILLSGSSVLHSFDCVCVCRHLDTVHLIWSCTALKQEKGNNYQSPKKLSEWNNVND